MENTQNKLTPYQKHFFDTLRNYIDKPIYFYGSIQRNDYLPGKSDIDIDIFTDNERSTIYTLCNFLNLKTNNFKKSVYKIGKEVVRGYKTKYVDEDNNITLEISLYNENVKGIIIKEHLGNNALPFHISIVLMIIKFLYYKLNIIPKDAFVRCKQFLMNDNDEMKFIVLDGNWV
jgi:hypothetical protein